MSDGVDFGEAPRCTKLSDRVAKTIDIGHGVGGAGARRGANPGRVGRPPHTSNRLNFGLDCAIGVPKTIDLDCEGCGAGAGSGANLGSVGRQESKKRLQKNCFECTLAHCCCVFELMNNNQCTRCVKFNLCCTFRVSGMFHFLFCLFFLDLFSNNNQLKTCCILHISEQGRRNDLNKLCSIPLSSNEQQVFPSPPDVSSDSVHCNALTQSTTVSYAFSCHTTDTCCEENDVESLAFASLTIGVVVPLCLGDYLLFHAQIPHCISSRRTFEDEIMCTSTYLKDIR